jgi:hypothetical protein
MPTYVPLTDAQITAGRFMNPFRFRDNPIAIVQARSLKESTSDLTSPGVYTALSLDIRPGEVWIVDGLIRREYSFTVPGGTAGAWATVSVRLSADSLAAAPGYWIRGASFGTTGGDITETLNFPFNVSTIAYNGTITAQVNGIVYAGDTATQIQIGYDFATSGIGGSAKLLTGSQIAYYRAVQYE